MCFLFGKGSRFAGAFAFSFLTVIFGSASLTPAREIPELYPTFLSAAAASEAVLAALEAGDYDRLRTYALSEEEFRVFVWPELPASRPERNLSLAYVWGDLDQKSTSCLRRLVHAHRGRRYELVRVEYEGETTDYRTFKVHRDARLVIRKADGTVARVDFFGSILEKDSRYKLFSYNVD